MTNFYYLYKYGAATQTGYANVNAADGTLVNNNFIGSMLQYNRFDMQDTMDFVTGNKQNSTDTNTFTDFYNQYKTIVGSDVLSYMNKYSNTTNMALGGMVNLSSVSAYYNNNLDTDSDDFYFRATQGGNPYRYTADGAAEALLDVAGTPAGIDFNDLDAAYQSYFDYKVAQLEGKTLPTLTSGINLATLGIDYATILASAPVGSDTVKAKLVYQNLVDQLVKEATAIKSGTITETDLQLAIRELDDKQRGLKAIDDALYGYVEKTPVQVLPIYNRSISHDFKNTDLAAGTVQTDLRSIYNTYQTANPRTPPVIGVEYAYGATIPGAPAFSGTDPYFTYLITPPGVGLRCGVTSPAEQAIAAQIIAGTAAPGTTLNYFVADLKTGYAGAFIRWGGVLEESKTFNPAANAGTGIQDLMNNLNAITVETYDASVSAATLKAEFKSAVEAEIDRWVEANPSEQPFLIPTASAAYKPAMLTVSAADKALYATYTKRSEFATWVNTHLTSLTLTERTNATDVLWAGYQRKKYVDELKAKVMADIATPIVQTQVGTKTAKQPDITEREIDNNYSGTVGTMYTTAVGMSSLISGIIADVDYFASYGWDDDDGDTNRSRSATQAVPAVEVYKAMHNLGIEITTDVAGSNVVRNGLDGSLNPLVNSGGVNDTRTSGQGGAYSEPNGYRYGAYGVGTQEELYAWLRSNPTQLIDDGNGKMHFTKGGTTYYINTNTDLDLNHNIGTNLWNKVSPSISTQMKMGYGFSETIMDGNGEYVGADYGSGGYDETPGDVRVRVVDRIRDAYGLNGTITGGTGTLEVRHLKATDSSKSALADMDPSATVYKPNTDTNSLVYQLADSLLASNDIVKLGSATDADQREFAVYLSEVSAGLMERYWLENFNKANPEEINTYFNREIRAYLNPEATSADKAFNFVTSNQKVVQLKTNFSEDPAVETIVDKIMEKQSWAQMFVKMEDRSRTEMALFEESAALDVVANINTKEFEYRMAMLGALENDNSVKALGVDFSGVSKNLIEQGPGREKNPWWSEYFPWFKGFYGNLPDGATPDKMFDENGHLTMKYSAPGSPLIDPYLVKINGVDYVMGKDENQDGEINNAQEILGIEDTIETTFASLMGLDKDNNGYVSQEELKSQNIIFKAMNENERMNGSSISTDFIKGIDLSTMKKGDGTNNIYGLFNVQLTNGQKAAAVQTFESQSYFNNLFGKYADMSFLTGEASKTTTETAVQAPKTVKATEAKSQEVKAADAQTSNKTTLGRGYNFFSYLKKEETTTEAKEAVTEVKAEEKKAVVKAPVLKTEEAAKTVVINSKEITIDALIDDICWKANVYGLSTKQRYEILDSVDTSLPSELIVKKVQDEIAQIHAGFSA